MVVKQTAKLTQIVQQMPLTDDRVSKSGEWKSSRWCLCLLINCTPHQYTSVQDAAYPLSGFDNVFEDEDCSRVKSPRFLLSTVWMGGCVGRCSFLQGMRLMYEYAWVSSTHTLRDLISFNWWLEDASVCTPGFSVHPWHRSLGSHLTRKCNLVRWVTSSRCQGCQLQRVSRSGTLWCYPSA